MSEALRLADWLDDTPNWQKESFGSDWKSGTMKFDSTPFEAAAELRRLHAENERLIECLKKANDQAEHFEREWYLRGDLNTELVEALRMSRDALNQMWQSDKARPALVVAERALAKVEASK